MTKTVSAIPRREEVDPKTTWSVEDLFAAPADWEQEFEAVKEEYPAAVLKYQGHLADSGESMYQYLQTDEAYTRRLLRLIGYASLRADEDTANTDAQARKGRLFSWLAQAESETAFSDPEMMEISDARMEELYAEKKELELYRRFFDRKKSQREHTLSAAEEKLLAGISELADAPEEIYTSLIYADLKFNTAWDVEGKPHEVTNGSFISLMESTDECLRKNAFHNLYEQYEKYRNTFASMLQGQVRQGIFFSRARKYPSAREAALSRNEVPVSVYDNLIQSVHDHMAPMHRYMEIRRRLLGTSKLHMHDLYVSLVPNSTREIPFEEAKRMVLDTTQIFGEEYSRVLTQAFEDRWMDIYENQGKRSGAYSSFTQGHPYVLLNHKDNLDSAFTLIHEMGHAMHSYLSHTYQPQVYSNYVIFVAEVASTCNEALLMQYLLRETEDKKERAVLLNYFLEQFRTTLYRQTMFAEFERDIYEMSERGETLTADVLSARYRELNREYYGPEICVDHEIDIEWARIPHFYYNFYVYQYATGFSAAIALSQKILREGKPAVEAYLNFLKGGCSADPITLLQMAGVDMTTKTPVAQALDYFGELLEEFDQLMTDREV